MSEFKMNFLKHPRIQERFQNSQRFVRKNKLWIISGSIALVIGLTSCVSVDHVVMMPSTIKGADFVGMAECTDCHEQLVSVSNGPPIPVWYLPIPPCISDAKLATAQGVYTRKAEESFAPS